MEWMQLTAADFQAFTNRGMLSLSSLVILMLILKSIESIKFRVSKKHK